MSRPNFVPVPALEDHTDKIRVDSLGLPVGFDQDRLLLNVPAIHRAMQWGDIGLLKVVSQQGERATPQIGIDGIDDHGTATSNGRFALSKTDIEETKSNWDPGKGSLTSALYYRKSYAVVSVDAAEKERRIDAKPKKWPRGTHDPKAQAHFIDEAIRTGLGDAAVQKQFKDGRHIHTLGAISGFVLVGTQAWVTEGSPVAALPYISAGMPVMTTAHTLFAKKAEGYNPKDRSWSYFTGIPFDRHLISRAQAQRTLVKAL